MIPSATQIGPNLWVARLHANGQCVFSMPVSGTQETALQRAQDEIEARSAAVAQARAIARMEAARARALPMLLRLVKAPAGDLPRILDEAREVVDGVELSIAAE